MKIVILCFSIAFLSACGVSSERSPTVQSPAPALGPLIEKRIAEWRTLSNAAVGEEQIYASVLVESFYKGRGYMPAWSMDGRLIQVETLIKAVEDAYGDGLTPDYYHLGSIRSLVAKVEKYSSREPVHMVDLDILLTDAFLTLGCHLSAGCVNPVTIEAEWFAKSGNVDVSSVLEQAVRKKQIREALTTLRPEQGAYGKLRKALAQYRELSSRGEWPLVSGGPRLKKGSVSDRVVELRRRLAASGDLEAAETKEGDLFDEKLEQSVISFQKRHGLKADGIVSSVTLAVLNVPLKQRIRQMELNMERLRWILGNHEQLSIVVNIANFELNVIEDGKSILSMKAVVGKPYMRTPVFTAKMTHLLINPSWNVPDSIARDEILKIIKKYPNHLSAQNIKVLRGWGPREEEIDPATIDWSKVTAGNLSYRFRQEPGPQNPLGRLKFVFPNKYDVYLHDTTAKRLFAEEVRAFSHGCTRIERPVELAEYLLRDDPGWSMERLLAAIHEGAEKKVMIPRPINVHFLYLTAWVDEGDTLQFRNDIYNRDRSLDEALRKKPSFH
ncbi:MAG TPA: L,D-transpeptidase family protein [Thermodesulfovibrionales bacterium]|nr:L,D-transpeptidase family protein [Thermodesulfovibrionales bacterium]